MNGSAITQTPTEIATRVQIGTKENAFVVASVDEVSGGRSEW
ncbi:hypothetical protein [Rathayibacter sp. VKM Ac-2759]|nr:hypothetical protein [Rathayibacter sp. VKM Ac-2759]